MSNPQDVDDPLLAIFDPADLKLFKPAAFTGNDASVEALSFCLAWRRARVAKVIANDLSDDEAVRCATHAKTLINSLRPPRSAYEQMEFELSAPDQQKLVCDDPHDVQAQYERLAEGILGIAWKAAAFLGAVVLVAGVEVSCILLVVDSALPDITGQATSLSKFIVPLIYGIPALAGDKIVRKAGPRLKKILKFIVVASVAIYAIAMSGALAAGIMADSIAGDALGGASEGILRGMSTGLFGAGIACGILPSIVIVSGCWRKFTQAASDLGKKLHAKKIADELKRDLAGEEACKLRKGAAEVVVAEAREVLVSRTLAEIASLYNDVANVYCRWSDLAAQSAFSNLPFELRDLSASDLRTRGENLRLNNSVPALMTRLEQLPS